MIQIAGAVHNTMYLNRLATNKIEDKVGFNDENSVAVLTKPRMTRHTAQKGLMLKLSDTFIKSVNKGNGSSRAVLCDELKNGQEIILSSRKIPKGDFTRHSLADGVWSSSGDVLSPSFLLMTELGQHPVFQTNQPGP